MTRLNTLLLLAIGAGVLVLLAVVVITPRVSDELSSDSNPSDTSSATSMSSPTPEVDGLTGKLLEVATGAITPLWGTDRHGGMLEFSADGRTLAFATRPNPAAASYDWQAFTMSLSPGPSQATLVGNGSVPRPSPDGKQE